MKSQIITSSPRHREAYLNEYKGLLFEFLVAQEIAKKCGILKSFIERAFKTAPHLKNYESITKDIAPYYIKILPELAKSTADSIFETQKIKKVLSIELSGLEKYSEQDIVIKHHNKNDSLISLKLVVENSFVNTKSAGMKSFIKKYFSSIKESQTLQNKINQQLERQYFILSEQLHDHYMVPFCPKWSHWKNEGLDILPGSLNGETREFIKDYYKALITHLKYGLERLHNISPKVFCKSLPSLIGFSNPDIIQVLCFYKKGSRGTLSNIKVHTLDNIKESLQKIRFKDDAITKGNFEIFIQDFILQIRIKPMNTFIAPSPKINCSVKFNTPLGC